MSFESLWNNFFESKKHRFKDTLYPAYQNFGKDFIVKQIKSTLLLYWFSIKNNQDKAFNFLNFAWEYVPNECLEYLNSNIEKITPIEDVVLKTKYETNEFIGSKKEKYLDLLSNFFGKKDFFLEAIELSFQYVERLSQHLSQFIFHIDQCFIFKRKDYKNAFTRHILLVEFLVSKIETGKLYAFSFFAISKTFLDWLHWSYRNGEENEEDHQNIKAVKKIRANILKNLIASYPEYPDKVLTLMLDASVNSHKHNRYSFEFDLEYLIPWIETQLNRSNFRHCYYVQETIRKSIKEEFVHKDFEQLKSDFNHPTYSLFELVNFDRRRAKDLYEFKDRDEFEELKKTDISQKLIFKSNGDLINFIKRYSEILSWDKAHIYILSLQLLE